MQLMKIHQQADLADYTDADLVELARRGGESAIRALIKRNNQRLFRVARGVLRNDGEAEDIVQETYARAFTGLASFRGDCQFSTWLTRIALNEAFSRLRRREQAADPAELEEVEHIEGGSVIMFPISPSQPGAEAELARKQISHALELAIDELPNPFRLVFILRDVEGLSIDETALQLELKPETVKTRLHRARRLMRVAIEQRLSMTFAGLFPFDGARCRHIADRTIARLRDRGAQ